MPVVELGPERCDALLAFFGSLPEGDLTFIKEEVTDPDTVRSWATDSSPGGRWVAVDGDEVTGYVALRPMSGWSDHVGELRLVVSPTRRGTGLGRELARRAVVVDGDPSAAGGGAGRPRPDRLRVGDLLLDERQIALGQGGEERQEGVAALRAQVHDRHLKPPARSRRCDGGGSR